MTRSSGGDIGSRGKGKVDRISDLFLSAHPLMVVQINKKGIRVLGIAESFRRGCEKSVLAGIVMRSDSVIDGIGFTQITVGGMDATAGILRLFRSLHRADINVLMLNGCVISWFNIIDLNEVYNELNIPLICVTYEEAGSASGSGSESGSISGAKSPTLETHIARHFDRRERDLRIDMYKQLGDRIPLKLNGDFEILIRFLGMEKVEANALLRKFTIQGKVPEPLRVAKIAARALLRSGLVG